MLYTVYFLPYIPLEWMMHSFITLEERESFIYAHEPYWMAYHREKK
jgi:hypothetical protein